MEMSVNKMHPVVRLGIQQLGPWPRRYRHPPASDFPELVRYGFYECYYHAASKKAWCEWQHRKNSEAAKHCLTASSWMPRPRSHSAAGLLDQCRNKNSFELISAQCTSSHARRRSGALLTWPSIALSSVSFGRRDKVTRNSSARMSLSAFLAAISLPMRFVALRKRSLTAGPLMRCKACARLLSPSRSHSQANSRAGWPKVFRNG